MIARLSIQVLLILAILLGPNTSVIMASGSDGNHVSDWLSNPQKGTNNENQSTNETQIDSSSGGLLGTFVKMIAALTLVVVLIYFLVRFLSSRQQRFSIQSPFRLMGGIGLGPNKSLQLIEIGDKIYLVGVGDNIELLRLIENENEVNQIRTILEEKRKQNEIPSLKSWFVRMNSQKLKEEEESFSFASLLSNRLNDVKQQKKSMHDLLSSKASEDDGKSS